MKKKIMVVLGLLMSLSLTACVSQKDYDALVTEMQEQEKKIESLNADIKTLQDYSVELQNENEELSTMISVANELIVENEATIEKLEACIAEKDEEIQSYKDQKTLKAKGQAVVEKTVDISKDVVEKTADITKSVTEKAGELTQDVVEGASDIGEKLSDKWNDLWNSFGKKGGE